MHLPLALDSTAGERIAATEAFSRREARAGEGRGPNPRTVSLPLADGRTLWVLRPPMMRPDGHPGPHPPPGDEFALPGLPEWFGPPGVGVLVTLAVLFGAISIGAYPVVRRLTRRLEALQQGVEAFGAGALNRRVAEDGNDEVAAVGASFNRAATRVAALLRSHQSLLANASHELRSPLTRMKMALALLDGLPAGAPPAHRERLRLEIETNIGELDALVEEVLLASRLDAAPALAPGERVDLLALAAEEAARVDASVDGDAVFAQGDERLLRRALRNLLENARRYGGGEVSVTTLAHGSQAQVQVCDRGSGVPEAARERIFEPFYRLPGHAEQTGGVGLGLSLVKQIAERHGGRVRCEPREGGGSCFVLSLPAA
jgi:signal transduction histidine kinase